MPYFRRIETLIRFLAGLRLLEHGTITIPSSDGDVGNAGVIVPQTEYQHGRLSNNEQRRGLEEEYSTYIPCSFSAAYTEARSTDNRSILSHSLRPSGMRGRSTSPMLRPASFTRSGAQHPTGSRPEPLSEDE